MLVLAGLGPLDHFADQFALGRWKSVGIDLSSLTQASRGVGFSQGRCVGVTVDERVAAGICESLRQWRWRWLQGLLVRRGGFSNRRAFDQTVATVSNSAAAAFGAGRVDLLAVTGFADHFSLPSTVRPLTDSQIGALAPTGNGPQIDHRNPVNGCERTSPNVTKNIDFCWDLRADQAAHNGLVGGSSPPGPTNISGVW